MEKFNYEKIPVAYYDIVYKKKKGIQSAWHHIKFNFVSSKIKTSTYHLDIGCGPGTFLGNHLKEINKIGLDISKNQIDYAIKKYENEKSKFKFSESKKLPFEDKTFESISLIEFIEHLSNEEIESILSEAKRCLKDHGKIIITTPNYLSFWPLLEILLNKVSKVSYEHQHINKFNYFSLNKILKKNSFKIEKIGSFMTISPFLAGISFKLAIFISKISIFNFNFGFLLYAIIKKNDS